MPGPRDRPAAAYSTSWEIKLLKAFGGSGGQWVIAVSRSSLIGCQMSLPSREVAQADGVIL